MDWWLGIDKAAVLHLNAVQLFGHIKLEDEQGERGRQDNWGLNASWRGPQGDPLHGATSEHRESEGGEASAYIRIHAHACFREPRHVRQIHTRIHRYFLSFPEGEERIHIQRMIGRGRSRSEPFCFSARGRKLRPLQPRDEFRVHFLHFPFSCTQIELHLEKIYIYI